MGGRAEEGRKEGGRDVEKGKRGGKEGKRRDEIRFLYITCIPHFSAGTLLASGIWHRHMGMRREGAFEGWKGGKVRFFVHTLHTSLLKERRRHGTGYAVLCDTIHISGMVWCGVVRYSAEGMSRIRECHPATNS